MIIFAKEILPVVKYIFKIKFYVPLEVSLITWQVENLNDIHHQKQTLKCGSLNPLYVISIFSFKHYGIQIMYCNLITTVEAGR
jgi:hypothetical protein